MRWGFGFKVSRTWGLGGGGGGWVEALAAMGTK